MNDMLASGQASEDELIASRSSLALARSERVLQSWFVARPTEHASEAEEEDDTFHAISESAALGAPTSDVHEDGGISYALRTGRASSDRLMEQLLGRKAAQAKKKLLQESRNGTSLSRYALPVSSATLKKGQPTGSRLENEDEGEEDSRAALFSSRKNTKGTKTPAHITTEDAADNVLVPNAEPPGALKDLATVAEMIREQQPDVQDSKSKKRKVSSYLDEVIVSRAKKKKKKSMKMDRRDSS